MSAGLVPRVVLILAGLSLAGCGSAKVVPEFYAELVPVTGTVTSKAGPVVNVSVSFLPEGTEAVRGAYGKTDAAGKYSLFTPIRGVPVDQTQGAVPGSYRVVLSKLVMPDGTELPDGLSHADAMLQGARESLPGKLSSQDSSQLTVTLTTDGTQTHDFTVD